MFARGGGMCVRGGGMCVRGGECARVVENVRAW